MKIIITGKELKTTEAINDFVIGIVKGSPFFETQGAE